VKWSPNSPPTSLGFTYIHISPKCLAKFYQIWLLLLSYAMCTIDHHTFITKHVSFKIHFQQFCNSNVTAILLCLIDVARSIVTSVITSIFFANSIVTSSITSIFVANSIVTLSVVSVAMDASREMLPKVQVFGYLVLLP
jgi:hypothetical protein